jgi:short-subunit dehydrogenase
MKYAITGHTQGIGKSLFTRLSPNCIGFSRTTGHDINIKQNRETIISDSVDCDVFINNAYSDINQVNLLYELYENWKDLNKIIVNIGSDTTCGIKKHPHIYTAHKIALDKASEQLSHLNNNCKVINIRFGWVGTLRVITKFNPKYYIDVDDAAKYIVEQTIWSTKYKVTECLIRP